MQAQIVVHEVPVSSGSLGGGMHALHPFKQDFNDFRFALHAGGFQHELGHYPHDMNAESPLLELQQVIDDVLSFNADHEWRYLGIYHPPAHACRRVGFANLPLGHVPPGTVVEVVHLVR